MQNLLKKPGVLLGGIVLILIVILIGVYFFGTTSSTPSAPGFFQGLFPGGSSNVTTPSQSQTPTPINPQEIAQQLETGGGRSLPQWTLIPLGNDAISSLVAFGTTTRYHKNISADLGHLFERTKQNLGEERRVSNILLQQVANVVWSSQGNKAVIAYYNEDLNIQRFFIEYVASGTPKTRFLDDTVSSAAFSPDGSSLAYSEQTDQTNDIFITDTAFKKTQKVLSNNIPGIELSWPSKNVLSLKTKSSYAAPGYLYTVSTSGGLLNKIVAGLGLDAIWSSDGFRVAYSTSNEAGRMNVLQIYDTITKKSQQLPLTTVAEKCTFGKKNPMMLYCGVPQFAPGGTYPDARWQG